jgi:dolichyl-phosphate-mannose--protein O-mannosyl transferase
MGSDAEWWLFTVFILIFILMLIVMTIRDYWAKRNLPKNPEDKRINRKLALNNLKFILGIREKVDSNNPMKEKADDDLI